jgi:hypothetical protein
MLVAVTSCRSDAYYAQKAPGAISMLPRKAPSALKMFHELAVGMKDAYEAVGATPTKMDEKGDEWLRLTSKEQEGRTIMWEFLGNVNFVSNEEADISLWHTQTLMSYHWHLHLHFSFILECSYLP